ncbi:MAG: energy-coupling factor transporter transmembrane component T [Gemmataceae bacterium]
MQARFDVPPLIDSMPARLDGRWRLAALLVAVACAAAVRSVAAGAACLVAALLLAALARMDWRWYGRRLAVLALLLALFALPLPLLAEDGGRLAAVLLLKALTLFTLTAVLLVTAPLEVTLKAAHALRVPGLLVQVALLTYRYLFVIGDELARLRVALRVRGFRNRADAHAYRAVAAAAGTLLVRGYERAERVAAAMRCRGFDGRFRSLAEFRTSAADVASFGLALALAVGVLVLDQILRI